MVDLESGPVRPESGPVRPAVSDPDGVLKRSRELLDLFWDIAKPERDTRLQAAEKLVEQLKKSGEVSTPTRLDITSTWSELQSPLDQHSSPV